MISVFYILYGEKKKYLYMQVFKDIQQWHNRHNSIFCSLKLSTCSYFMFLQHTNSHKKVQKNCFLCISRSMLKTVYFGFLILSKWNTLLCILQVVSFVSIFGIQLREWYCKTTILCNLQNPIPFFPWVTTCLRDDNLIFVLCGNFGRSTM